MRKRQAISIVTTLALLALAVFWPASVSADFTYQITVDTSSLAEQPGNLDFQFNPGDSSSEVATAIITNFQTSGGILALSSALTGDASGSLPGTLTLDNGTIYNDIFQGFTYGTSISFDVTLSGPAVDIPGGTVGSSFAFSLYDSSGFTPLLTTDMNGSVATINLNPDGTTSVETFAQSPTDNSPVASVSPAPAPPTIVLLAFAAPIGLVVLRRSTLRSSPS